MKKTLSLLLVLFIAGDAARHYAAGWPGPLWHQSPVEAAACFSAEAVPAEPLVQTRLNFLLIPRAFAIRLQIAVLVGAAGLGLSQGLPAPTTRPTSPPPAKTAGKTGPVLPRKTLHAIQAALEKLGAQKLKAQTALDRFEQALQKTVEAFHAASPIPEDLKQRPDASQRIVEVFALSWVGEPLAPSTAQPESLQILRQALEDLRGRLELLKKARDAAVDGMAGINPKSREYESLKTNFNAKYKASEELRSMAAARTASRLVKGGPPQIIYQSRYYQISAVYSGGGQGKVIIFKGQKKLLAQGGMELGLSLIGRTYDLSHLSATGVADDYKPLGNPYPSDAALQAYLEGKFDIAGAVEETYGAGSVKAWSLLSSEPTESGSSLPSETPVTTAETRTEAFQRLLAWFQPNNALDLDRWLAKQNAGASVEEVETIVNIMDVMAQAAGLRENAALSFRELYLAQSVDLARALRAKHSAPAERAALLSETRRLKADSGVLSEPYKTVPLEPGETKPRFLGRLITYELERRLKEAPLAPRAQAVFPPHLFDLPRLFRDRGLNVLSRAS